MMKIVSSPSKAPAAVASQIVVFMMGALNDCEGIYLGATASTADRTLPVGTKSAYIKASTASRNQFMYLFGMVMVACAIKHWKNVSAGQTL
jgi:hypothetical protein